MSAILGEALERYLDDAGGRRGESSVVAASWGTLKLDRRTVARLLADEEGLLDA